jgi:hypothetical protein
LKKNLWRLIVLLMVVFLVGCGKGGTPAPGNNVPAPNDDFDAVVSVVESFGKKLQMVSLQAPADTVKASMQEHYAGLVSPNLLQKWQSDPQNAPGRMVSSPWPERIEILSNEKLADGSYKVKGEIIEITSIEQTEGGFAAKRMIDLIVRNFENKWLIDEVALGAYIDNSSLVYQNTQYGFDFKLPKTWAGYSIVDSKWEGVAIAGSKSGKIIQTGPIISIRHPQWTKEVPRQDIPIMVFTLAQWKALQDLEFSVGAAPIGPSELGRNSKYVFALPARYNYAFPKGFEEVEDIVKNKPLTPTETFTQP